MAPMPWRSYSNVHRDSDRHLHALPLYHCAQLDVFLGPSIMVGGYNLIVPAPAPDGP